MLLILATGVASGRLYEGPLKWPTGVKGLIKVIKGNICEEKRAQPLRNGKS